MRYEDFKQAESMSARDWDYRTTPNSSGELRTWSRHSDLRFWILSVMTMVAAIGFGLVALVIFHSEQIGVASTAGGGNVAQDKIAKLSEAEVDKQVLEFLSSGQQSKAEDLLKVEVAHYPRAVELAQLLASGKSQESERFLHQHAAELREGQRVLFLYAACKRSRFDLPTAFRYFNAVWAMNPETPEGQCAQTMVELDSSQLRRSSKSQIDNVFADARTLIDANPDDVVMRWMLAVECRNWDRNAEGVQLYKQVLDRWQPGPALVHQTYANLLDNLARYEEALVERYRVVKLEPAGWSYDGLGNTLDNLNRFREAGGAHALAVEKDPRSSSHWSNWANSLNGDRKFSQAIEKCQRAIELDKSNWRAWWIWGKSLEAQGNPQEAVRKYKEGLAASPSSIVLQKLVAASEARREKAPGR